MSTLTRPQFEAACQALIAKICNSVEHSSADANKFLLRPLYGWSWYQHHLYPGLGYLSRTVSLCVELHDRHLDETRAICEELHEVDDEAAAPSTAPSGISWQQYVVYSPTYRVPAFYFSVFRNDGVPLTLAEIASLLFHSQALPDVQATHGVHLPDSAFAMISQGDHPVLGTPCWYLHPCRIAEVVGEIMSVICVDETKYGLRWLEAWFMITSNLVTLDYHGRSST